MSNYLDLRDLAKELDELKDKLDMSGLADEAHIAADKDPLDEDERERYEALCALERDLGGDLGRYADNEPTAIPEDEFVNYAQELAEDTGAIQRNASWPNNHIDWDAAADALKQDYTSFDFEGTTYLVRDC